MHPLFAVNDVGHGRVEERALHVFATDGMALDFPYARSVVVVRSQRTEKRTQKTTHETRYYVSSLDPEERKTEEWHGLIRGNWAGVENRNHWRRDALFGEDRPRSRNANLLTSLALLRNALLRVLSRCFQGESVLVICERIQSDPALALNAIRS